MWKPHFPNLFRPRGTKVTASPLPHRYVSSPWRRGRILGVKFGVNPNSSSIGSDLSVLLIGAAGLTIVVNLLDALLRGRFFKKHERKNEGHGEGSGGSDGT